MSAVSSESERPWGQRAFILEGFLEEVGAQVRRVLAHLFSHSLGVSSDPHLPTKTLVKCH